MTFQEFLILIRRGIMAGNEMIMNAYFSDIVQIGSELYGLPFLLA